MKTAYISISWIPTTDYGERINTIQRISIQLFKAQQSRYAVSFLSQLHLTNVFNFH